MKSNKGLLSKIDKEFLKTNSKKIIKLKNGLKTLMNTSLKRIYRWQITI